MEDRIALRYSTIDQKQDDVLGIVRNVVEQEEIVKILVSVPKSLSGEETAQTRVSLDFVARLKDELGDEVEVEGVDEVFSSKEARRNLQAEGGKIAEEHVEAARLMLADYLAKHFSDG